MVDGTLEELKRCYAELDSITEKQEKRVRYYESTTMKLVVAYIILQTLIFISVSHSNLLCKRWWLSFCLSSLNAVLFVIPYKRTVRKWERTEYYYEMHFMDQEMIHHKMQIMMLQEGKEKAGTNITINIQDESDQQTSKPDVVKLYQRNACIYLATSALAAYTAVVLIACRSMPCN